MDLNDRFPQENEQQSQAQNGAQADAPNSEPQAQPQSGSAPQPESGAQPYYTYDSYGSSFQSHRFDKPKKQPNRRGVGVWTVLLCCVLSLCCGFGGAWAYNALFGSGGSVILQTVDRQPGEVQPLSSLADVAANCRQQVVEISTEVVSTSRFFTQYISEGAGSGVILSEDGYIVTNYHVIAGARNITVTTSDGQSYPATVHGYDVENDLAVVKINARGLPQATFGDSSELRVGDLVLAIGNPLGSLGGTTTNGIVSALDRQIMVEGQQMTLLQHSAAVSPGNSGGGLFDTSGNLIGVVNAKSTGTDVEGLGFAIPSNAVQKIVAEILEQGGSVNDAPLMGVNVITISDTATAQQYRVDRLGVYIVDVTSGYGAEAAGLRSGDYIVSIADVAVANSDDISAVLADYDAGDHVDVQIIRDGRTMTFRVELMAAAP